MTSYLGLGKFSLGKLSSAAGKLSHEKIYVSSKYISKKKPKSEIIIKIQEQQKRVNKKI